MKFLTLNHTNNTGTHWLDCRNNLREERIYVPAGITFSRITARGPTSNSSSVPTEVASIQPHTASASTFVYYFVHLRLRMHQFSTCPAPVEVGVGNYFCKKVVTAQPRNGLHKIVFGCVHIYYTYY